MRAIASACGVTATSLYYYYKDKDAVFMDVKLVCMEKMTDFIESGVVKQAEKYRKQGKTLKPHEELRTGLTVFRDWAFANPRIARLVMERLPTDTRTDPKILERYNRSIVLTKGILDRAVKAGESDSKDTLLDTSLCIVAIWGAIEAVLSNRPVQQHWSPKGGIKFTNKMIDLLIASLMKTEE
jgi:AcrR family transcriptional regulator